jgi:hypothetical protein
MARHASNRWMMGGVVNAPLRDRPLRRAALACCLAVISGLAATGCGGAAGAAGRPVPARAVPRLTALALRAATLNGDPRPQWATAVLTTYAKALTSATPGDFIPGAGGQPVFLVTMRGHFVAWGASIPHGAKTPAGTYLSIVVDAKSFRGTDSGLSHRPPPVSPASLGPVTYLVRHGH